MEYDRKEVAGPMVSPRSWKEFHETGLLWWINRTLHLFGWALVMVINNEEIVDFYPARVGFRGFGEKSEENGFKKVSSYLQKNAEILAGEAREGKLNEEDAKIASLPFGSLF